MYHVEDVGDFAARIRTNRKNSFQRISSLLDVQLTVEKNVKRECSAEQMRRNFRCYRESERSKNSIDERTRAGKIITIRWLPLEKISTSSEAASSWCSALFFSWIRNSLIAKHNHQSMQFDIPSCFFLPVLVILRTLKQFDVDVYFVQLLGHGLEAKFIFSKLISELIRDWKKTISLFVLKVLLLRGLEVYTMPSNIFKEMRMLSLNCEDR